MTILALSQNSKNSSHLRLRMQLEYPQSSYFINYTLVFQNLPHLAGLCQIIVHMITEAQSLTSGVFPWGKFGLTIILWFKMKLEGKIRPMQSDLQCKKDYPFFEVE